MQGKSLPISEKVEDEIIEVQGSSIVEAKKT